MNIDNITSSKNTDPHNEDVDEYDNYIKNVYKHITNNKRVLFLKRKDDCIKEYNNVFKNVDNNSLIVYSGILKTRNNILEIKNGGINTICIYNVRELNILKNYDINFILKIKNDMSDIGIYYKNIKNIEISSINNLVGIYISLSKKIIIDTQCYDKNIDEYDNHVYEIIDEQVKKIIDMSMENRHIKLIVLDILDTDNKNKFCKINVLFKLSIYNYIKYNYNRECYIL